VTGAELVVLAATQIGKPYVFGADVDLESSDPPAFDCAEFASWLAYKATRRLYGCVDNAAPVPRAEPFSGGWASDIRIGLVTSIPVEEAFSIAGAVLVRAPAKAKIGHVAISDGDGGTVEAHSARVGVARRPARGRSWTHAGLLRGVTYSLPDDVADPGPTPEVLRIGARGPRVLALQEALVELRARLALQGCGDWRGLDPGKRDGDFGPLTRAAVYALQVGLGLVPDGEVGVEVRAVLGSA
jgi:hypothetical protein